MKSPAQRASGERSGDDEERILSDAPPPRDRRWKLLAAGVLLAWLVLVHLLVNVWLLLLFSSIMAALGAWLGPHFILSSATPIHLERFLTLEHGCRSPDAEAQLDKEISLTIQKIVQDFVSSWYRRLSHEATFEDEVSGVMWDLSMALKQRLNSADREAITRKLLVLAGCHLQCYKWAKARVQSVSDPSERESLLWEAYQELSPAHQAMCSPPDELAHTRWLVDSLLTELVPQPHLDTRSGRHLVVELIACNVVLPLMGRMSDPDWINIVLTTVLSRLPLRLEEARDESPAPPSVPRSLPLSPDPAPQLILPSSPLGDFSSYDEMDCADQEHEPDGRARDPTEAVEELGPCKDRLELFSVQYLQPPKPCSPFFLCEESELESPLSDLGREMDPPLMNSSDDLLSDCCIDALTPAESPILPAHDESGSALPDDACLSIHGGPLCRPEILVESTGLDPEFISVPDSDKEGLSPMDASPVIASSPTAPLHPFSFVPLSSPDGPVLIQNLRITGTITAREHSGTGSHPYTLYTIKYDTALDCQSLGSLQPMAYHTVNRRYREFLNLQTRLEEKSDLRKFIKHIKGPKKFLPDLPFGNMDSEKVEARKSLLEAFLQLCAVPEIASSEEVQEFLALNTDARIAFVKKPFLVSRIDKIVVNAIVDTLKTAFPRSEPQSPTDDLSENEVDGKSQNDAKKSSKSRLRFPSSKIAPVLSSADAQEKIVYCVRDGSTVSDLLSVSGIESFIQKQEALLSAMATSQERSAGGRRDQLFTINPQTAGLEGGLAAVALEVLWLLMREQWSWLCTDAMQRVTRLLCGSLIQRWLEVQVVNFTCLQRWALYLRLIQQAIWPGGKLRTQPRPVRTAEQREAARRQALHSLMGVIPDPVQEILGVEKCRLVWQAVLDSLQNPQINR
ncbi:sorting nexin-19 isoform X2 [Phyllobates terribilis]|uniref:sorting nexin-19 isoform X2 n=1 Tax=Phyllobates terribilis TaxID=111132 RepID=UPI003CCB23AC